MDSFKLKQLFKKYLEGKSSAKEEKSVDDWYRKNDNNTPVQLSAEKEQELKEAIWMQIEPSLQKGHALQKESPLQKETSLQNAPQIITQHSLAKQHVLPNNLLSQKEPAAVSQLKVQRNYTWMKVAASVMLVLAAGLLWYSPEQPATKPVVAFSNISTAAGQRKVVTLSDGSTLTLNSASAIRIATDFSTRRNVQILDGEVYFEVKHDTKRPFIIRSGPMTTQVLGTSFNVRAYKELNKFSVGVTSGKVGVMIPNQPVAMLVKGRQLIYNKHKNKVSLVALDHHLLDWQKGSLILNDASFEEMAVLVRKNFNISVSTTNQQIAKKHFTATLSTAMSAGQAVEVIAAIHKRSIKKRRDTIEIY